MASERRIEQTRQRLRDRYLNDPSVPGITGVGRRNGNLVLNYDETMRWRSWGWLQLTRWVVWQPIQMGKMRRPVAFQSRTERHQVVPGGVSVGEETISAGTVGFVAKDKDTGERGSVSNFHVYGKVGSRVFHPGPHDNGTEHWATTKKSIPVSFTSPNKVDCAWAVPLDGARLADHFLESGPMPTEIIRFAVGDPAMKEGRTTAVTNGTVDQIEWEGDIGYGGGNVARFIGQDVFVGAQKPLKCRFPFISDALCFALCKRIAFLCSGGREKFLDGGDSGSAVRRQLHELGSLAFAGSDTHAIGNVASDVIDAIGMEL